MEIPAAPPGNTPPPAAPPAAPAQAAPGSNAWQVGQILQAIVSATPAPGQARLQVGSQVLQAQTPVPLQSGQRLSLEVIRLGPQPDLRILTSLNADPVSAAIRAALPRQAPLTPLLANLQQLAQGTAGTAIPANVADTARQLFQRLPDSSRAGTAEGLRQAVENSGLFMESRLAGGANSAITHTDMKANLYRLLETLRQWPGQPAAPRQDGAQATTSSSRPTPAASGSAAGATPQGGSPPTTQPPTGPTIGTPASPLLSGARPPTTASAAASLLTAAGASAGTPPPGATSATTQLTAGSQPPPLRGSLPQAQAAVPPSLPAVDNPAAMRSLLLSQVESALARVTLQQLASVPADGQDARPPEWLLELPLRREGGSDLWSVRIARDEAGAKHRSQEAPPWSVTLAFELEDMGPVQARVALRGEKVSTTFWAGQDSIVSLFREHLDVLNRRLRDAGLEVEQLHCLQGSLSEPDITRPGGQLLKDKA